MHRDGTPNRSETLLDLLLLACDSNVMVLDAGGTVVLAHQEGGSSASLNDALPSATWEGRHYLDFYRAVDGLDAASLKVIKVGIQSVLSGNRPSTRLRYTAGQGGEAACYTMKVRRVSKASETWIVINLTGQAKPAGGQNAIGRAIFDLSAGFIVLIDAAGKILDMNPAMLSALGYTLEEVVGSDYLLDLVPEPDRGRLAQIMQRHARTDDPVVNVNRVVKKNGDTITVQWHGAVVRKMHNGSDVLLGIGIDITETEQAYQALADSESQYRSVVENAKEGILVAQDGRRKYYNQRWLEFTGYTKEQYDAEVPLCSLVHPEDRPCVEDVYRRMVAGEPIPDVLEFRLIASNGQVKWISGTVSQIQWEERPAGVFLAEDVTDQKKRLDELRISQQEFSELARLSPVGIYKTDAQGHCVYVNDEWCRMAGMSPEEALGHRWVKALHPEDHDRIAAEWYAHARGAKPWNTRYRFVNADGYVIWVYGSASALRSEAGEVIGYLGVNTDITKIIETKQALQVSEEKFRTSFEASGVGMALVGKDGKFISANAAACKLLEYSEEELKNTNFIHITRAEDVDQSVKCFNQCLADHQPYSIEKRYLTKQGAEVVGLTTVSPIFDSNGEFLYVIAHLQDMTARVKAEEALRRSSYIINESTDTIVTTDPYGTILSCNKAGESLFGYELSEFIGQHISILYSQEEMPKLERIITDLLHDRKIPFVEVNIQRKDGSTVPVTISLSPLKDANGSIVALMGITRDISEQKQAREEIRRLKEFYNLVLQNVHDGIWVTDAEDRLIFFNAGMESIAGVKAEAVLGLSVTHDFPPETIQHFIKHYNQAKDKGVPQPYEAEVVTPAGRTTVQAGWLVPRFENGQHVGMICTIQDVTEQRKAEQLIHEQRQRLQQAQRLGRIGDWQYDLESGQITWSEQVYRLFDRDPELGPPTYEEALASYCTEDAERVNLVVGKVIAEGVPIESDHCLKMRNGETVWHHSTTYPLKDATGKVVKLYGTVQDITERKNQEHELIQLNRTLEAAQRMAKVGYWRYDVETQRPTWSDQMFIICGRRKENGVPSYAEHRKTWHPDDWETFDSAVQGCIAGTPYNIAIRIWFPEDQTYHHINTQGFPIVGDDGQVKELFGTSQDITDLVSMEEALKESELKYRTIVEGALDGIVLVNRAGQVLEANDAYCQMIGYSREELLTMTVADVDVCRSPADIAEHLGMMSTSGGDRFETQHKRKDGRILDIYANAKVFDPNKGLLVSFISDITERKQAERALQRARDESQRYLDVAGVMLLAMDTEQRVTLINPKGCEILGYRQEEILGRNWFDEFLPAESVEKVKAVYNKIVSGNIEPAAYNENSIVTKDGARRMIAWQNSILYDESGTITGVLCSGQDITEQREAEEQLLTYQRQLKALTSELTLTEEHLKKNIALQLHDNICQSLVMLQVSAGMLAKSIRDNEAKADIDRICKGIGELINEARNLTADLSYPELHLLGFEEAVGQWSSEEIQSKHDIRVAVYDDGRDKPLDEDLKIVLFRGVRELLTNVVKHAEASKVDVVLKRKKARIVVQVKDNGKGSDMQDLSDKRGFGIVSIRETLERLGGDLTSECKPGQGFTATMTAPLASTRHGIRHTGP